MTTATQHRTAWTPPEGAPPQASPPPPPQEPPGQPAGQTPRRPEDPGRAAAIWVSGTGAALLLAAAALFLAVNWGAVPDEAKLGALSAATGGALLAGHLLRPRLGGTAGVLWHLGALLVPLNAVAVGVHLGWSLAGQLAAAGSLAAGSWWLLGRREHSVVLDWCAVAALPLAVAGVATLAGLPPAVVLALVAAAAVALGAERAAAAWATVAGIAPVLPLMWEAVRTEWRAAPSGVVGQVLELVRPGPGLALVAGGALATGVLLAVVHRRRTTVLLPLAAVTATVTALAGGDAARLDGAGWLVLAAGAFLAVELAAGLLRHDPFWKTLTHTTAAVAEVGAALMVLVGPLLSWALLVLDDAATRPSVLIAGALAVAGWLVADLRRAEPAEATPPWMLAALGSGFRPTAPMVGLVVLAVLPAALVPTGLAAGIMAAIALVVLFSARPLSPTTAVVLLGYSLIGLWDLGVEAAIVGVVGALAVAHAAVLRARVRRPDDELMALGLLVAALGLALGGTSRLWSLLEAGPVVALGSLALTAWLVGAVAEAAPVGPTGLRLGLVGRAGAVAVAVVGAVHLEPAGATAVGAAVAAACLIEGLVRRDLVIVSGIVPLAPAVLWTAALALGAGADAVVLVLCTASVVAVGAHLLAGDRWLVPTLGAGVACAAAGLVLAGNPGGHELGLPRPEITGAALVLVAGAALCEAIVRRSTLGAAAAWSGVTVGVWLQLDAASVVALEAWVAPVAVALLGAGIVLRRRGGGSWAAYGPVIALAGGSALVERLAGGDGHHALMAGAVGVAAVIIGGARRLAAPLMLGTALLVASAGYESLAVTAQVPTPAWLALAGALLLATGIGLERSEHGPIETGQRLVDTIGRRFS